MISKRIKSQLLGSAGKKIHTVEVEIKLKQLKNLRHGNHLRPQEGIRVRHSVISIKLMNTKQINS
jgi:hypothetical protein